MNEKGIGKYHIDREKEAQYKIFNALKDGEWHRYQEIIKQTQLSTATATKHLKKLKILLQKKLDTKSGKYPYPVYYRLDALSRMRVSVLSPVEEAMVKARFMVEKGEPRMYLHYLFGYLGVIMLQSIKTIKDNEEIARIFYDVFVIWTFNFYARDLMAQLKDQAKEGVNIEETIDNTSKKFIDDYKTLFESLARREPSFKNLKDEFQELLKETEKKGST